jgi:hypothetical protein
MLAKSWKARGSQRNANLHHQVCDLALGVSRIKADHELQLWTQVLQGDNYKCLLHRYMHMSPPTDRKESPLSLGCNYYPLVLSSVNFCVILCKIQWSSLIGALHYLADLLPWLYMLCITISAKLNMRHHSLCSCAAAAHPHRRHSLETFDQPWYESSYHDVTLMEVLVVPT